jgi:hypothetical protein
VHRCHLIVCIRNMFFFTLLFQFILAVYVCLFVCMFVCFFVFFVGFPFSRVGWQVRDWYNHHQDVGWPFATHSEILPGLC